MIYLQARKEPHLKAKDKTLQRDFGILYVATGRQFIDEAVRSASSARKVMPSVPTAIYLDDPSVLPGGALR